MKMKTELLIKPFKTTLLVVGLMFALAGCEPAVEIPETEAAFVFPEAVTLENFELTHHGQGRYDINSTKGKWSLFFFGYTRCPDVCPTELFMMAEMMRKIDKDPSQVVQPPQVVFVSLDPSRTVRNHYSSMPASTTRPLSALLENNPPSINCLNRWVHIMSGSII
jgi:cytochrome oxidase Cu insertion factor (SCO1/SenC/PrrC family)